MTGKRADATAAASPGEPRRVTEEGSLETRVVGLRAYARLMRMQAARDPATCVMGIPTAIAHASNPPSSDAPTRIAPRFDTEARRGSRNASPTTAPAPRPDGRPPAEPTGADRATSGRAESTGRGGEVRRRPTVDLAMATIDAPRSATPAATGEPRTRLAPASALGLRRRILATCEATAAPRYGRPRRLPIHLWTCVAALLAMGAAARWAWSGGSPTTTSISGAVPSLHAAPPSDLQTSRAASGGARPPSNPHDREPHDAAPHGVPQETRDPRTPSKDLAQAAARVTPAQAARYLTAGRHHEALRAYRTLATQSPHNPAYAFIAALVERDIARACDATPHRRGFPCTTDAR